MVTVPTMPSEAALREFFRGAFAAMPSRSLDTGAVQCFFYNAGTVVATAERQDRDLNRLDAHRFNLLRWMDMQDENNLSDLLADLLDPSGTHGQGGAFLQLFLEQCQLPTDTTMAVVQREAPTYALDRLRRMDILIVSDAILVIENKNWAGDQPNQVADYLQHLQRVTDSWQRAARLIYLAPDGRRPKPWTDVLDQHAINGRLLCWSYPRHILPWLENCRRVCNAVKIRCLLEDFAEYIRTDLRRPMAEKDEK